jgi:DNA-binding CsgD family transcriptional regulator/pimeloyl-ACP methyl ester carboxylesterase
MSERSLATRDASPPIRFAEASDGTRVSYVLYPGTAPPFLIVQSPGAPSLEVRTTSEREDRQLTEFRRERSGAFFDWRGTGLSGRIGATFSIDHLVGDLEAVTSTIGPVDAKVWGGASFPVCLHAAAKPERYRSLQLEGAALRWGENRLSFVNRPGWEVSYVEHLQTILRTYQTDHDLNPAETHRRALRWAKAVPAETFGRYLAAQREADLTDVLPRIRVPTWVVARVPVDYVPAGEIAALLPNATLTIYPPDGPDLRTGAAGRAEWDRYLGAVLGDPPASDNHDPATYSQGRASISPRQRAVLERVAIGETNQEIGEALGIAEGTVKRHVSDLLHKTDLKNRRQLMRFFDSLEPGGRERSQ